MDNYHNTEQNYAVSQGEKNDSCSAWWSNMQAIWFDINDDKKLISK